MSITIDEMTAEVAPASGAAGPTSPMPSPASSSATETEGRRFHQQLEKLETRMNRVRAD